MACDSPGFVPCQSRETARMLRQFRLSPFPKQLRPTPGLRPDRPAVLSFALHNSTVRPEVTTMIDVLEPRQEKSEQMPMSSQRVHAHECRETIVPYAYLPDQTPHTPHKAHAQARCVRRQTRHNRKASIAGGVTADGVGRRESSADCQAKKGSKTRRDCQCCSTRPYKVQKSDGKRGKK